MDYLKAFVIGTAGPVWIQHIALLSLRNKNEYDYSFKAYSIIAPIYYGLMTMFALYIGKIFNLSLSKRLFIISIISICSVVSFNYFVSRKKYKPYKNYTTKEWFRYILTNGARHIIAFNLIIFYFTKYFSKYYWLRLFIIGSSIFIYLPAYLKIILLDNKDRLNYDYKTFAVTEPISNSLYIMLSLYILKNKFKYKLKPSLIIYAMISPFLWLYGAYTFKTYKHNKKQWKLNFIKVYISFILQAVIIYYLLTKLK